MKKTRPIRVLPEHLNLDQLKRQAKELLDAVLAGEPDAVSEAAARYPGAIPEKFALHDAQLVLARAYGFQSWPKLRANMDGATMQRLRDAIRADDSEQVRHLLKLRCTSNAARIPSKPMPSHGRGPWHWLRSTGMPTLQPHCAKKVRSETSNAIQIVINWASRRRLFWAGHSASDRYGPPRSACGPFGDWKRF